MPSCRHVQAAHERDLPVTAHVQGRGQAERAVGAGIDEFAHTPWTERLPDPLLEAAARTMRMVSTLDILSFGDVTQELRTACDNLVRFRTAGGTVVYGTDLGNGAIPPGIHLREALLLHEAVRMKPEEVLVAMTAGPIAVDGPADLIVLGSDPLVRLEALGDLRAVVRAAEWSRVDAAEVTSFHGNSEQRTVLPMEFLILGPLEVSDGGRKLALGGPKQRAVLAHLILRANHVVPADLLIDVLWGEEPPESARNTLQINRLSSGLATDLPVRRGRRSSFGTEDADTHLVPGWHADRASTIFKNGGARVVRHRRGRVS
jgi:hypothetical protein